MLGKFAIPVRYSVVRHSYIQVYIHLVKIIFVFGIAVRNVYVNITGAMFDIQ